MSLIQRKPHLQVFGFKIGSQARVICVGCLSSVQHSICLIESIPGGMVLVMLLLANLATTSLNKSGNQHILPVSLMQKMMMDGSML